MRAPRTRHTRRKAVLGLSVVSLLVLVAVGGGAWYFSDQLLAVTHSPAQYNVVVLNRAGNRLKLSSVSGIANQGRFGLDWRTGHAIVGPASRAGKSFVVRPLLTKAATLRGGMHVRYSVFVYRNPHGVGLPYRTVRYPDPLGPTPAWFVPGLGSTWVISVHGIGSSRAEAVRAMPVLHGMGLPILDIGYRNDRGAPASSDHLYHLGGTEWRDLEAAARFALEHGARRMVLYGYSMGGNVVESFMHHSPYASRVRVVVLDAPALDWYQILELAAEQRDIPGAFASVVERVVAWRLGMWSLDGVDQLIARGGPRRPTLLYQGTADDLVPPNSNREFAAQKQNDVTLVMVPGAGHVQSWNVAPRLYDRRLRGFLLAHLSCRNSARTMTCV